MSTNYDVTPKAIARRQAMRKVSDVMYKLTNNNITVYTDVDGNFNDNWWRTRDVLIAAFVD